MDLGLLYSDFVMDKRELILHTAPGASSIFRDDMGSTHCTITAFQNGDPDIVQDPLSTNRRLADSVGLQMFGTMVVAGPTPDVIYVLIPGSTTSTADDISPADLQHVVGLSLGPTENLCATLPRDEVLTVAHRDLAVARRNVAEFTYYLDLHSAHLAACVGALDDTVPLMSAETFPCTPGGIRSALKEARRDRQWLSVPPNMNHIIWDQAKVRTVCLSSWSTF